MPNSIILDTDIGTDIDDTWAIGMLVNSPELSLEAVVSAHAETRYRAVLLAKLLDDWGYCDVPIGIGVAGAQLERKPQAQFLGDYDLNDYPGEVREDGVGLLVEAVMAATDPVVVSIGPATNVAAALEREPGIAQKARFVGMHGAIRRGYRGGPEPVPEYNVYQDVAAFRRVLEAPWDITLTPLDTCGVVFLKESRYRTVKQSDSAVARAVMDNYRVWSTAVGAQDLFDRRSTTLYDTVAVLLAFDADAYEKYLEMEDVEIAVRDDGLTTETVGSVEGRRVHAALGWRDLDGFEGLLVDRLVAS